MKKALFLSLAFFTLLSLPLWTESGHDHRNSVHSIMHEIALSMNSLKKAARRGDYRRAKVELKKVAAAFKELDSVEPRRGSKEEWDEIHGEIIRLAGEGLKACDQRDRNRLTELIELIEEQQMIGHYRFR